MNSHHELLCTIQCKQDLGMNEIQFSLAQLINHAMLFSPRLKELHALNTYKPYVFCMPYPRENDRVYKQDRLYCFNLRTLDFNFAVAMKNCLTQARGNVRIMAIELKAYTQQPITELACLTPVICTVNNRCWMPENGLGLLAERLHINALRKYKTRDNSFPEPEEFFFEHIEVLNRKPIVSKYKQTFLLGHKVSLKIRPEAWAQQLAFTVWGQGAGEKNALGFGYCVARR